MEMTNENGFFKAIEDEYLQSLPPGCFAGPIVVIDSHEGLHEAEIALSGVPVLGFDTETKPAFKKGQSHKVALLQLATNDQAFLFRLNKIHIPKFVIRILEDPNVIKAGVALKDDINGLVKRSTFKPQGFVDLQQFVKQYGIEDNGLKKLVGNILGFRISKRFQTSNWETETLSQEQLCYAATDAWVCQQIYRVLLNNYKNLNEPILPDHPEVRERTVS